MRLGQGTSSRQLQYFIDHRRDVLPRCKPATFESPTKRFCNCYHTQVDEPLNGSHARKKRHIQARSLYSPMRGLGLSRTTTQSVESRTGGTMESDTRKDTLLQSGEKRGLSRKFGRTAPRVNQGVLDSCIADEKKCLTLPSFLLCPPLHGGWLLPSGTH